MYRNIGLVCALACMAFPASAERGIDPTRPLSGVTTAQSKVAKNRLVLQSIVENEHSRKAIINGKILKVGDSIGQYELVAINARTVVLNSLQKEMELSLFSATVAKSL